MARQKKTDGWASELPDLTDKQLAYVTFRMEGKNQTEAYRAAYDTENMQPNSVWREASLMESHPKVSQWMNEAKRQGRLRVECTLEGHLAELDRLKAIAVETGNVGAAVQAEKIRGEVAGHKIDRLQVQDDRQQITDVLAQIQQTMGAEMAETLARSLGVEWNNTH